MSQQDNTDCAGYPVHRALPATTLPQDSEERKRIPLYSGVLRYFPAALAAAASVSRVGNDKHNPGQPLHHARGKSMDHGDCILRHLMDLDEDFGHGRGYDDHGMPQVGYIVWRAMALAQEWLEKNAGAPLAPGAVEPISGEEALANANAAADAFYAEAEAAVREMPKVYAYNPMENDFYPAEEPPCIPAAPTKDTSPPPHRWPAWREPK